MFIILYTDLNFYDHRQSLFPVLLKTVQSSIQSLYFDVEKVLSCSR